MRSGTLQTVEPKRGQASRSTACPGTSDSCCPTAEPLWCCQDGKYCCDEDRALCCEDGQICCADQGGDCCEAGETCCGPSCCQPGETCCNEAIGLCCGGGPEACCPTVNSTDCCVDGETCCGDQTCCPSDRCCNDGTCCPFPCNECTNHGSLWGGMVTVDPNPACLDDTITFTASGVTDTGGQKRENCVVVDIAPVAPTYEWVLTIPGDYPPPLPTLSATGNSV